MGPEPSRPIERCGARRVPHSTCLPQDAVEYRTAERMCPLVDLDRALLEPNLDDVEAVLTSTFWFSNRQQICAIGSSRCVFVTAILEYVVDQDDSVRV